jgi:hypothetical protein
MKTENKLIKTFCLIITFMMAGTAANAAGGILGDVNHDGTITMSDANMVVNYFLAATKPNDFDKRAGDVNNDGDITMSDANQIVNMFLSGAEPKVLSDPNGHEYVDLGLSVKWATCNIGAGSPIDRGAYFAWGETEPKNDYTTDTYEWCDGSVNALTKYNTSSPYGTVDNKTTLEPGDDAAVVHWGGSWRMPTRAEMRALCDSCYWEWTMEYTIHSMYGYIVYKAKSKDDMGVKKTKTNNAQTKNIYTLSDPHIFLPITGFYKGTLIKQYNSDGYGQYWSSTLGNTLPYYAYRLSFSSTSGGGGNTDYDRRQGRCVRAVLP